jgi:hypothetical protein
MTRIRSDPPKQPSSFSAEERRLLKLRKKGQPDVVVKASSPRVSRWMMLVRKQPQQPVKKSRITLAKVWK